VIVLADRVEKGEWHGDEGQLALRQIAHFAETAVILCAGASHRELVERGVRRLGYHRHRLFGSAPEALASAVRAIVAVETNASPRDVALSVLGVPPSHIVVPWEDATVAGTPLSRLLGQSERRRIAAKVSALWPPGPRTLAAASVKVLAGMLGPSRQSVAAFVAPDDAHGVRARAAALQVRLGPQGIERVFDPRLDGQDQVAFENATLL
jgi:malate/lactate dehydrogenase